MAPERVWTSSRPLSLSARSISAGSGSRGAGESAAASETGSDGGAWLDGDAAGAAACDASMIPVVTGEVDPGVLEELVRLCAHLDRLRCCAVENSEQRETQEDEKTGLGVVFLFQIAKKRCNRTASDLVTKAWMTSTANL